MESECLAVFVAFVITIGKLFKGTMESFGFGPLKNRFSGFGDFRGLNFRCHNVGDFVGLILIFLFRFLIDLPDKTFFGGYYLVVLHHKGIVAFVQKCAVDFIELKSGQKNLKMTRKTVEIFLSKDS